MAPPKHAAPATRAVHGAIKPAELRELGLRREDCLDFSASISPLGPPDAVTAAVAAVDFSAYPDPRSLELCEAVAAHHRRDGATVANVLAGNGSTEIIHLLTRAWVDGRDRTRPGALILTPAYGEYAAAVAVCGGGVCTLAAERGARGFRWHADTAAALIAARRPALAFVCNPNNPTGALLAPPEIEALAGAAAASGTLLVVDEAYHPLSTGHDGAGAVALAAAGEPVVALRSMTKDYALAGLRLGYAVAGVGVIGRLQALQPDWSVNALAQAAGVAALADRDYPERARAAVAETREYVQRRLGRLGIRCYPSTTNFVLAQVGDAAGLRGWLARQGLFVRDCTSFGLPDCIRIGLRPVADCSRLIDALTSWRSGATPRP
ncbi:MAG: histidinol-phosphate transaminase [Spirochaetaceae bacterium]|nr:histidinol-phosphate transaminase [Spirochaetaceae bacterium]